MEFLAGIIDIFLHLDRHLHEIISAYGTWTYVILFLIVFAETGLVVTPFLPGDSLLFAAGAIAARGSLDAWLLSIILILAAILGDSVNYADRQLHRTARLPQPQFENFQERSTWTGHMRSMRGTGDAPLLSPASCPSSGPLRHSLPASGV
jgi:membrane protein YqaA with SNARE-associated domain